MLIYKITNLINGKMYVGKTKRTLAVRFDEHARKGKFLIGKAICKYGKENFRPEIIATCETVEEANGLEKYWIKTLNCKVPNFTQRCRISRRNVVWINRIRKKRALG